MTIIASALLGYALAAAPAFAPFQPLAQGMRWNYTCNDGISATRSISTGAVQNVSGFVNMLTVNIPGQASVQYGELELNDSQGTKIGGFVFSPTYPSVPIDPPQLELPLNPVIGQSVSFPDGSGGTVTVTYQGLSTVTVPAGIYTSAVFRETDSGSGGAVPFPKTTYMVRGIGEIASQTASLPAQNLPATTCQLVSYSQ